MCHFLTTQGRRYTQKKYIFLSIVIVVARKSLPSLLFQKKKNEKEIHGEKISKMDPPFLFSKNFLPPFFPKQATFIKKENKYQLKKKQNIRSGSRNLRWKKNEGVTNCDR